MARDAAQPGNELQDSLLRCTVFTTTSSHLSNSRRLPFLATTAAARSVEWRVVVRCFFCCRRVAHSGATTSCPLPHASIVSMHRSPTNGARPSPSPLGGGRPAQKLDDAALLVDHARAGRLHVALAEARHAAGDCRPSLLSLHFTSCADTSASFVSTCGSPGAAGGL